MSEIGRGPSAFDAEKRKSIETMTKVLGGVALGEIFGFGLAGYQTFGDHEMTDFEHEGKSIAPDDRAELDAHMDEALKDLSIVESDIKDMVTELEKAGATPEQVTGSKHRYAMYIADRYRAKVLEIADKIEKTE